MPPPPVIGLEVHIQLRTSTKMFCRCPNRFGAAPNTLICPVCLGYPGTLPVLNRRAVELAARLALALGADVRPRSAFARKSYFYPDLPKGYQITQHDEPLATGGTLPLADPRRSVRLRRLHLEEDAGRLLDGPDAGSVRIDFNRCGVPLVEVVTEPDLAGPEDAREALTSLHRLLLYTGVADANLEEGGLRCDANVSLPAADGTAGPRVEIKNLNSFRHLGRALAAEIERQRAVHAAGGAVTAQTRGWDDAAGGTVPLRDKEATADYRYLPEPDLPPLEVTADRLAELAAALPELPWARRDRLVAEHGLSRAAADALCARRELADYYDAVLAAAGGPPPGECARWILRDVRQHEKESGTAAQQALPPGVWRPCW